MENKKRHDKKRRCIKLVLTYFLEHWLQAATLLKEGYDSNLRLFEELLEIGSRELLGSRPHLGGHVLNDAICGRGVSFLSARFPTRPSNDGVS